MGVSKWRQNADWCVPNKKSRHEHWFWPIGRDFYKINRQRENSSASRYEVYARLDEQVKVTIPSRWNLGVRVPCRVPNGCLAQWLEHTAVNRRTTVQLCRCPPKWLYIKRYNTKCSCDANTNRAGWKRASREPLGNSQSREWWRKITIILTTTSAVIKKSGL